MDKDMGKFYLDWDESEEEGTTLAAKINAYLEEYGTFQGTKLEIGMWETAYESQPDNLAEYLVENKEKFPNLKELYWGDISYEECEVSWIQNTDIGSVVNSFAFEKVTAKGGCGLKFRNMKSDTLKELVVISGGTEKETLKNILDAELPNLEHLEIYLGVDEYGFDGKIEDIIPFTKKEKFPKLKYLGLKNSEIEDEICKVILESDILPQLEVLDLSYGTLGDEGVQLLLDNSDKISHLKELNIYYNYASKELLNKLKAEMEKLNISFSYEQDDVYEPETSSYRYPFITE